MAEQCEMRLAGLGGQGLILAGIIVAEAAGIHEGKEVVQTQAYGAHRHTVLRRAVVSVDQMWLCVMRKYSILKHPSSIFYWP
jgi:Pyruvate/2-oxoacid:ferredoxin oxidoreductase gamma subunit